MTASGTISYSTYLGGNDYDSCEALSLDSSRKVYLTGTTYSTNYPTSAGAYQTTNRGGGEAFVTKLDPTLSGSSALVYSTYLGGSGYDSGRGIIVDSSGNAFVSGATNSSGATPFPTSLGAYKTTSQGNFDVFVTKLSSTGSLTASTYLGGSSDDLNTGLGLDNSGQPYVSGFTYSSNYPTTTLAYQTSFGGGIDSFVTKLNTSLSSLSFSTYLGGNSTDVATRLATDSTGNVYVTGYFSSTNFPTTPATAYDTTRHGGFDTFVTELSVTGTLLYSTYLGGSANDLASGLAIRASDGQIFVVGTTFSANFPTSAGAYQSTNRGNHDAFVTRLNPTVSGSSALIYSTYLGGSAPDLVFGVAIDSAGNAYLSGNTYSVNFPSVGGSASLNGNEAAFVTKLSADGSQLLYVTYLGGSKEDSGRNLVLDSAGNAYLTGSTGSPDLPTTVGAYQTTFGGGTSDAYLAKLSITGTLLYSTYLGGSGFDYGNAIAVDTSGKVYLGGTTSGSFPVKTGSYDTTANGGYDVFVSKLDLSQSGSAALVYSTYLGGSSTELAYSLSTDSAGNAYLTGYTQSSDYPTSTGAYDTSYNGGYDVFVTKLNASGSGLVYSTFLGGSGGDAGYSIAVDGSGNAYVTGSAEGGFPTTTGAYQTSYKGGQDAFVTKLNSTGTALVYSTYLGDSGTETGWSIALDPSGNGQAYIGGFTTSATFPTTSGAYQTALGGGYDGFVVKLSANGQQTTYSTYLGGSQDDFGTGMAVDSLGNLYLAGYTRSPDFPTSSGAYQTGLSGGTDGFVAKLAFTSLEFITQPVGGQAGSLLSVQPVVRVKQLDGSTYTSFSGNITLTIKSGSGTSGAALSGTVSVPVVSGIASFTNLSINLAGTGYILSANGGPLLAQLDSAPFNIGTGAQIVIVGGSNQSTAISTVFGTQLAVKVLNSNGQPITNTVVTFTAPGSGASGTFTNTGTTVATATTDALGIAIAAPFKANGTVGLYSVSVTATGVSAPPALFTLINTTSTTTGGVSLTLDPGVSGPNPISSTVVLTATLKRHGITPLASQPVTLTVSSDVTTTQLSLTATTSASGEAVFSYSRTFTTTDSALASAVMGGVPIQSNAGKAVNVYWIQPLTDVHTSVVYGSFFDSNNNTTFVKTPADQPLFTKLFPGIFFPTISCGNPCIPFADRPFDVNGTQLSPDIIAEGNGYQAGVNFGNRHSFQSVFTGTLIVKAAGTVSFYFLSDAGYIFSVGGGAQCGDSLNCPAPNQNSPTSSPFLGLPLMSSHNIDDNNLTTLAPTVYFPAPGVYPYEVDYFASNQGNGDISTFIMGVAGSGTNLRPAGSISISPTNVPASQTVGQPISFTVTVTDVSGLAAKNVSVTLSITGANQQALSATTDAFGQYTFTYTSTTAGLDSVQAIAWPKGALTFSALVNVNWIGTGSGGTGGVPGCSTTLASPSLISNPINHSQQSGRVDIKASQSVISGTIDYWPVPDPTALPSSSTVITSNVAGAAGATLASLDTTLLANGAYIIRLCESGGSTPSASLALINVVGENKPGRVAFSLTDMTVPVAGLPIVIGRTYDSLERNKDGDFGKGWKLTVGDPRLEVNPAGDVTLTTLDGKRVTFFFTPGSPADEEVEFLGHKPINVLGFLLAPLYTPEAGAHGRLNTDGCGLVTAAGNVGGYLCFPGGRYLDSVGKYIYTDPYGRQYTIAANGPSKGKLLSLTDLNGNTLSFDNGGIKSSSPLGDLNGGGYVVTYTRDITNHITTITDPLNNNYTYRYGGAAGGSGASDDLTSLKLPGVTQPITYTYYIGSNLDHFFKEAFDPRGNRAVYSQYDPAGRLITVTDAVGNSTGYTYNLSTNTTIATNPDGGTSASQTDGYGKTISQTEQVANGVYRTVLSGYDAKRNLISRTDAAGTTGYAYDVRGNQTIMTNTLGFTNTTAYNPYSGPTKITNQLQQSFNVGYNPNFLPNIVTDTLGTVGGYSFDERGTILTRSDGNDRATSFEYDTYGNKTKETDPLGNANSYFYDNLGRMTVMTDALGYASASNYDALGRLLSSTAAYTTSLAATTTFQYDPNGNKISETDPLGHATVYSYDAANRLTSITYTNGTGWRYTYDWRGSKLSESYHDGAGSLSHTTGYGYDLAGELVTTTYAVGTAEQASVVNAYDSVGRKVKEYNAFGVGGSPGLFVQYDYDAAGRLTTLTNQLIQATTYTYDKAGHKLSEKDPNNHLTSYHYDDRGRLDRTTYPTLTDGTVISTTQSYDNAGNLLTRQDGAGKTTRYNYDEASRLISVTNPLNQPTSYRYDKLGRLLSIIDANVHSTGLEYDALGRQTRKIWPDNSFEQYGYDLVGNRTSYRLSDGNINTFQYDLLNRLSQTNYFDGKVVTYTYTLTGQRDKVGDSRGVTSYSYDNRDRVTGIIQAATGLTVTYGYDVNNNRASISTKAGTTSYDYYADQRLKTVTDTTSLAAQYSYDPAGRRQQLNLANGVIVQYGYDNLNRLTNLTQSKSGVGLLGAYTYTLGLDGNRLGVQEANGRSVQWQYDAANRLTREANSTAVGITTTYSYDAMGNRQTMQLGSATPVKYAYNELDQLTVLTDTNSVASQYSYKRGNLIQTKQASTILSSYQWNGADRLITATVSGGSASYSYDADGRRIKQTQGANVTNYLWDEQSQYGDVVVETNGSNAVQANYVLGNGELISQQKGSTVSYYLKDGQGSVRALTGSSGTISENYNYSAFGNLLSGPATPATSYLYTGQQFDALTGLYDLRARYYNPGDGRFLNRDKASLGLYNPIELSRYIYTANNPITNNDPSGYSMVMSGSGSGTFEYGLLLGAALATGYVGAKALGVNVENLIVQITVQTVIASAQFIVNSIQQTMKKINVTVAFAFPKVQGEYKVAVTAFVSTWGQFISDQVQDGWIEAIKGWTFVSYFDIHFGTGSAARPYHAERLMVRLITGLNNSGLLENDFVQGAVLNRFCSTGPDPCTENADEVGPSFGTDNPAYLQWNIGTSKKLRLYSPFIHYTVWGL